MNTKSGWKSLTGTTNFGEIVSKADLDGPSSDENAYRLAFDLFTDRILNYVGSYYLKLNGNVDALVFSGGIGERSHQLRDVISKEVECLGFGPVDPAKNNDDAVKRGNIVVDIMGEKGAGNGKRILVCKTDEQLEMARVCALEDKFWR